MSRGQQSAVRLFRELFAAHPAHVAMLDTDGVILAVNHAWTRFGQANGLADEYQFEKRDYLDVCQQAAAEHSPYAQDAMVGLLGVLKAGRPSYSMLYPFHSPSEKRWFRMWVQTQQPEVPAVVVAHTYVGHDKRDADKKQPAGRSFKSGRPAQHAIAYPWLYIGLVEGAPPLAARSIDTMLP